MPPKIIDDLAPDFEWFKVTAHNEIQLESVRGSARTGTGDNELSDATRIALSLNQICCDRGCGRFYMLSPPPHRPSLNEASMADFKAFAIESRAGELFFVYEDWTEETQTEYKRMSAVEKVHRLRGITGYVADGVPGLMIGTNYDAHGEDNGHWPLFNGATEAPVTLLLSPRPHIGLTKEITAVCERVYRRDTSQTDEGEQSESLGRPAFCFWQGQNDAWRSMLRWRVWGLDGVLDKIIKMYSEPQHKVLMCFGTARMAVLQDKQEASLLRAADKVKAEIGDQTQIQTMTE